MNKESLRPRRDGAVSPSGIAITPEKTEDQARFLTPGRIAVINGWIIAMLGIVLYCAAMLGGAPGLDGALLQRSWMGSGAIILLGMGVLLWFYGAYTFLQEIEDAPGEEDGPSF